MKQLEIESDFGRRFGWVLLYEGKSVAELDYIRWDQEAQFWHSYSVRWIEPGTLPSIPFGDWQEYGFVLRSKKYKQIECKSYMAAQVDDRTVLLRGAYVPSEVLLT